MKTIIMAGGKGTRIASVASDIPKPMIPLHGKPILEYQLECLRENGLSDIIIGIGHLGQAIQDYFGDGAKFGCHIVYYAETSPLGTAGALYKIAADPDYALNTDFILLHGDTIFDLDFSRFIAFHYEKHARVSLVAHPNSHPFDSALLITDSENRVIQWLNKEDPRQYYQNQVNAGVHILSKTLFTETQPDREKVDLDRDILKPLISSGEGSVYAYSTPEYIKDMGTPDRYAQVAADIKKGLVKQRNLSHKQKAIFLDRDGTLNKLNGFITKPEQFDLLDGVTDAIRAINEAGFLAIVITNQPVIARGEATPDELRLIHNKLETELGKAGAYIDDIFFCPHHPDKGFAGERLEYKIDCNCRKPKPGMILSAARKYNIDLSRSYMVGDDMKDVEAGRAAGCKAAILLADKADADAPAFPSLAAFVNSEIREKEARE
ncbi:MAG: HAD-IIIA family hydrolase [Treponema sp.]|jgi:D,D-heptose 1,7-bisphosphate phosphatase|nr:HAD-IIIA family hydrolase [Treponema sp.]